MADDAPLTPVQNPVVEIVQAALGDASVPKLYANGFAVGLTNADVVIAFQLQGKPAAILNLSFTLAKTLAQRLSGVVSELEAKLDTKLVTTDKIDETFK